MFGWGVLKHSVPESVRYALATSQCTRFWYRPIPTFKIYESLTLWVFHSLNPYIAWIFFQIIRI